MPEKRESREAKALMCLLDAITDKAAMDSALKGKIYPPAVFHAQQMSEKAAKACLTLKTDYRTGHNYMDEFRAEIIPASGGMVDKLKKLYPIMVTLQDLCSLSRYSVSPNRIRYRRYPEKDVLELCNSSDAFFNLCFDYIEIKTGLTIPRNVDDLTNYVLTNYKAYIDILDLL